MRSGTSIGRERRTRRETVVGDFAAALRAANERARAARIGPKVEWQTDPVGYARTRLKRAFMFPHQIEMMESVRDNEKTACAAGQKIGKTLCETDVALWFYEAFPRAQVVMMANTASQVRTVLWAQLAATLRSLDWAIEGTWSDNPATGFRSPDGRIIRGITARELESLAGISGPNLLFILDEASALSQPRYEAIDGNRAGSGNMKILANSNPTRVDGPFADAFYAKRGFWHSFRVDSRDVARQHEAMREEIEDHQRERGVKVTGELEGVVTERRIAGWLEEYGPQSVFMTVRVFGAFLVNEGGKPISLHLIVQAQAAHADADEDGELSIGIDPAGPGRDDSGFAIVRGKKCIGLFTFHGLSEDALIEQTLGFIRTYRRTKDGDPRVMIDAEGPIGTAFYRRMRAIAQGVKDPGKTFSVHEVRASRPIKSYPQIYDRTRDHLIANLARWLEDGGGIPADRFLEAELHVWDWINLPGKGTLKLTDKDDVRKKLGRSPDRCDALALAVWRPAVVTVDAPSPPTQESRTEDFYQVPFMPEPTGNDPWWPNG
jgi:hypothetical protein